MGHHCLLSGFPTGKYCSDGDIHPDVDDDQGFKMCLQFGSNAFQREKFAVKLLRELLVIIVL